jgi:hypothetical protein
MRMELLSLISSQKENVNLYTMLYILNEDYLMIMRGWLFNFLAFVVFFVCFYIFFIFFNNIKCKM